VNEQIAQANGIEIAYETFGRPEDPPLLLIMGLGTQMIHWHDDFCRQLVDRGFYVIRFDNRDAGHSTRIEGAPPPDVMAALTGDTSTATYTLDDMADDSVGLLDALDIEAAHAVGASMGGMIAQTIAVRHPSRILSLTSIMSTTGSEEVGQARPEALPVLLAPAPADRDGYVENALGIFRTIGSPGYDRDEGWIRALAGRAYDRSYDPFATGRQLVGIIASGDRTAALADVKVPTLVIHGADDPLIQVSGGEATAKAVPGAELITIPGMGHDLPPGVWSQIIDAIVRNTERVQAPA
jgi:pimeloyl-ACP methyl ester carboxylesterase